MKVLVHTTVYISWINFLGEYVYITPLLCIRLLLWSHENMCSPKYYNTEIYTLLWVKISCTHTRPKQIIIYIQQNYIFWKVCTYTPFIYLIKYIGIHPYSFHLQEIITFYFQSEAVLCMRNCWPLQPNACTVRVAKHVFGGTNTSLAGPHASRFSTR
jgi:hypothetical protein